MNDRLARVTLMRVAEPGDPVIGRLIATLGVEATVSRIRRGRPDPGLVRWFTGARPPGRPDSPAR
ncbi:hypothetical protein ACFQ08_37255, partial [Streptosporangium algeriense]